MEIISTSVVVVVVVGGCSAVVVVVGGCSAVVVVVVVVERALLFGVCPVATNCPLVSACCGLGIVVTFRGHFHAVITFMF
jgi:hypothetical protein